MAKPFRHILIPYDGSPHARQALVITSQLCQGDDLVEQVTIVRVISGGYLARHVQNVDLRVTRMDQVREWQRVRRHYLEHDIIPQLEEAQKLLRTKGAACPIHTCSREGQVGEEILKLAEPEGCTTIVMGRRGLSPLKELLLGGATRTVLNRARGVTVFVVGGEASLTPDCPITPVLLPVDGSEPSLAAVRQAAVLARAFGSCQVEATLLHVVDLALLSMELATGADLLVREGEAILAHSRDTLRQAGFVGVCTEKLLPGRPSHSIAATAQEGGYPLILMGHKGRSLLENLLMGSVAIDVVHRLTQAVVGLVCL